MLSSAATSKGAQSVAQCYDLLENGTHFSASEFLRRYEASPDVKKAELVNGIVYIPSPVRLDHGEPDSLVQGWLGTYAFATPGAKSATNSTVRLGPDDVPQPDALLRIVPECGGQARVNTKGYLEGAPELIVEVAASSTSLDTREKLLAYRRAGVREYLIWRTAEEAFDWWVLEEDEYRALPASSQGVITSQVFAGLWLDVTALLAGDGSKLMAKLHEGIATPAHAGFVTALQARAKEGRS